MTRGRAAERDSCCASCGVTLPLSPLPAAVCDGMFEVGSAGGGVSWRGGGKRGHRGAVGEELEAEEGVGEDENEAYELERGAGFQFMRSALRADDQWGNPRPPAQGGKGGGVRMRVRCAREGSSSGSRLTGGKAAGGASAQPERHSLRTDSEPSRGLPQRWERGAEGVG